VQRFVCVHGHFYQPPRENPWTGEVDREATASPYHNWNERITAECYEPNGAPLGGWPPNYSRMSFDFGPTLLTWLETNAPEAYGAILDADRASRERFSGHGSALAHAYNHMILPLANRRDKVTQVRWGIRDFERRFGRSPEGMWLPETAVDSETLEVVEEHGLAFTILAPSQAAAGAIDPRMPYRVRLPSGRAISVFFYDGALSHTIAFGGFASGGEALGRALLSRFSETEEAGPQLVHVATDGETYGHHFRGGEIALAAALEAVESSGFARLTNYGEYLERFAPSHEVGVLEGTSWSCVHGVERWRADCGCSTGADRGSTQAWRRPLRDALDWLRDTLAPLYEAAAAPLLTDPWAARDASIELLLDSSDQSVETFFQRHAPGPLSPAERATALGLLDLQRHALLMYTSCGWFFDDPSGLETRQVLRYAARAVELAEEHLGGSLEPLLLRLLAGVESSRPGQPSAAELYRRLRAPLPARLALLPT